MYGAAAQSGWWMGPYSTGGDSHEGILRNTGALKNGVSMLGEARAAPGATRPAEGGSNQPANRLRKVYAHLWENWETVRYFDARMTQIRHGQRGVGGGQMSPATGRTVLRGSYPWPLVPSVGENPNDQPDVDTPLASRILDPAPCGYFIPQSEYTAPRIDPQLGNFGSVEQRLADPRHHGRAAHRRRVRAAAAAVPRADRPDPRLGGRAADDRDRPARVLLPG